MDVSDSVFFWYVFFTSKWMWMTVICTGMCSYLITVFFTGKWMLMTVFCTGMCSYLMPVFFTGKAPMNDGILYWYVFLSDCYVSLHLMTL